MCFTGVEGAGSRVLILEFLLNILHVYMLASTYLLSLVGLGYMFQGIQATRYVVRVVLVFVVIVESTLKNISAGSLSIFEPLLCLRGNENLPTPVLTNYPQITRALFWFILLLCVRQGFLGEGEGIVYITTLNPKRPSAHTLKLGFAF